MGIDWYRVKFIASDSAKGCSYWGYHTRSVGRDLRRLAIDLPKEPRSELVAAPNSIAIIFHGPYAKIAKTIDRICDKIMSEGMTCDNSDSEKRTDANSRDADKPGTDGAGKLRK